jgi:lysozyme family protein
MSDLAKLSKVNATRWTKARITRDASEAARRLCARPAKTRYQVIARETAVPWFVIALIHWREAGQSWAANLAQGDPWDRVSIHVPRGRGPFRSFEAAAVDALTNCQPYAAGWKDWTAGGAMTLLEQYNGLGYAARGLSSPYVWAGTDQYERGKFVADSVFDPNAVDRQLGCACILKAMMAVDPSIAFAGEPPKAESPPKSIPPQSVPAKLSVWAALFLAVASIFRRRKL